MKTAEKIALIAVTRQGVERARALRRSLRTGTIFRPAGDAVGGERVYDAPLSGHVAGWFQEFDHLVFFLAAGAVVRLIAPCLGSKTTDPGVLAVDEAGQFVIPLLSGHQGGANSFARQVAGCLGAIPVITTASDVIGGLSLDLLEKNFGWSAEPAELLKPVAMSLVQHEPVAILQELAAPGSRLDQIDLPANVTFVSDVGKLSEIPCSAILWITDRVPAEVGNLPSNERILWFRPRSLALGVGCERGIPLEALQDGLDRFLQQHGFSARSIDVLATATLKEDETGLIQLAERHGWQTAFYPAEELARVPNIPNPSAVVARCVATPGVAEPAALLAAGGDRLLVEKQVMTSPLAPQRMTFALARLATYQRLADDKGTVTFIGAGPGDPELLTLKAARLLKKADVVIYAGSLIPPRILDHVPRSAVLHNSAHMTLEQVREVTQAAVRQGKQVARLQSGDPSIYGAIQEQIAYLEEAGIDYDIVPGISSFQAAAAALKSELTVPEVVQTIILTRGEGTTPMPGKESLEKLAQHQASLCLFLSARLAQDVQEKLLTGYPPETPVALVFRVSWPEEKILVTRLDQLAEEIRRQRWTRTVLILVGQAIGARRNRSHLYDPGHGHIFRGPARETLRSSGGPGLAVGGIVLCGGQSRRMGKPKAWLRMGDETLLERTVRLLSQIVQPIVVVAAPDQDLPSLPGEVLVVRDSVKGRGPLQGLADGLAALQKVDAAFVTGCDAPFLQPALVVRLIELVGDRDICVPFVGGVHHPLTAVYRLRVLDTIKRLLAENRLAPRFLVDEVPTRVVTEAELADVDPGLQSLRNLNTAEDYEAALTTFANVSEPLA